MSKKGISIRRRTQFKAGNNAAANHQALLLNPNYRAPQWMPRMTPRTFDRVVIKAPDGTWSIPDSDGNQGQSKFLRPIRKEPDGICDQYLQQPGQCLAEPSTLDQTVLVDKRLNIEMFNSFQKLHRLQTSCADLDIGAAEDHKQGSVSRMKLKCKECNFVGDIARPFKEAPRQGKRGPAPAASNIALQVGVQETAIANTGLRTILSSINLSPPTTRTMQKYADAVGKNTVQLNQTDMNAKLRAIRNVNIVRGVADPSKINIETDARYNSVTIATRKRSGQAANLGMSVAREHVTNDKFIVSLSLRNKLCQKGAYMRKLGLNVTCPGHDNCTANLSDFKPINEGDMAADHGERISKAGYKISHLTTDGDSKSLLGLNAGVKRVLGPNAEKTERLADAMHRSSTQFKHGMKMKWSDNMYPGRTKVEKRSNMIIFLRDVGKRTNVVVNKLLKKHGISPQTLEARSDRAQELLPQLIKCYNNDCSDCCKFPEIECKGKYKDNWVYNSYGLKSCGLNDHSVNLSALSDQFRLSNVLKYKLGRQAMSDLRLNTNTQGCESFHRSVSSNLPKNVNLARNSEARISAMCLRQNNGYAKSLFLKLEASGCPVTKGSGAAKCIVQVEKLKKYRLAYAKRPSTQKRKSQIRLIRETKFHAHKKLKSDYQKGLMEPQLYNIQMDHGKYGTETLFCKPSTITKRIQGIPLKVNRKPRKSRQPVSERKRYVIIFLFFI